MAPEKTGRLLLRAFRVLREPTGLTIPQLTKFYCRTLSVPQIKARLLVQRALRQAESAGFVERVNNRFVLDTLMDHGEAHDAAVSEASDNDNRSRQRGHRRRKSKKGGKKGHKKRSRSRRGKKGKKGRH